MDNGLENMQVRACERLHPDGNRCSLTVHFQDTRATASTVAKETGTLNIRFAEILLQRHTVFWEV